MPNVHLNPHPGAIFSAAVLKPLGISVADAARQLGVPRETLRDFVAGKSPLDPVLALKIGACTGVGATAWMAAQARFSLQEAIELEGVAEGVHAMREARTDRMNGIAPKILETLFPIGPPKVFDYFYTSRRTRSA